MKPTVKKTRKPSTKTALYKRVYSKRYNKDLASSGIPLKRLVKLKYCQNLQLGNGATSTASHHMSCNSLYDPDVTSIGHQPYGYDTWTTLYGKYRVLSSKIVVRFVAKQGTQNVCVGVLPVNVVDSDLSFPTMLERPGCYYKTLTTQFPTMITRKWSLRRVKNDDGEAYSSGVTDSPANQDYFRIWCATPDGGYIVENSIGCVVEISYIAELSERKVLSQS